MADIHRKTSACVDPGCRYNLGLPSGEQVLKCWKKVVYKQECPIQVIYSRDVEAVLIKGYYAQTILSLYKKKSNKLERICEHESSSKSGKIVANIHVSLQFCGKAALKRRITLSYKYRASEEKIHFFHQKILIVGLIVKFYKPFIQ